jgi:Gas vesicle protein
MQDLDTINVTEVLDRVLDHGIVLDPATRVLLLGVDLQSIKAKVVVESVQTYLGSMARQFGIFCAARPSA